MPHLAVSPSLGVGVMSPTPTRAATYLPPTPAPVQLSTRTARTGPLRRGQLVAVAAAANTNDPDHQARGMFGMPLPPIIMSAFVGAQPKVSSKQNSALKSAGDHATAEQPMGRASSPAPVMAAYGGGNSAERSGPSGMPSGSGLGGAPGPAPGPGGDGTGMISVAELDSMLAGLKSSLQSIQASRAEYVELLQQRDAAITTLTQQLAEKEQQAAELESQLMAVQAMLEEVSQQPVAPAVAPAPPPPAARAASPPPVYNAPPPPARSRGGSVAPQPPHKSPSPGPPPAEVTLYYRTGWRQAYLHCNMDGKGWTVAPGIPMEAASHDLKQVRVPCARLEFVLTNGKGDWDSPAGNYHINAPGTYRLESGKVHKA